MAIGVAGKRKNMNHQIGDHQSQIFVFLLSPKLKSNPAWSLALWLLRHCALYWLISPRNWYHMPSALHVFWICLYLQHEEAKGRKSKRWEVKTEEGKTKRGQRMEGGREGMSSKAEVLGVWEEISKELKT